MLTALAKTGEENRDDVIVLLAKQERCCVEETFWKTDFGTHRRIVMWDGTIVLDEKFADGEEDPTPPFLDVVDNEWEACEMRYTLKHGESIHSIHAQMDEGL